MARPFRVSQTGIGASRPYVVDLYVAPGNIAVGVTVSGSVTYTVQHTYSDISGVDNNPAGTPANAIWFDNSTINMKTTMFDGNYNFPPIAIRLNVVGGTGTATMTVIQAGASYG